MELEVTKTARARRRRRSATNGPGTGTVLPCTGYRGALRAQVHVPATLGCDPGAHCLQACSRPSISSPLACPRLGPFGFVAGSMPCVAPGHCGPPSIALPYSCAHTSPLESAASYGGNGGATELENSTPLLLRTAVGSWIRQGPGGPVATVGMMKFISAGPPPTGATTFRGSAALGPPPPRQNGKRAGWQGTPSPRYMQYLMLHSRNSSPRISSLTVNSSVCPT